MSDGLFPVSFYIVKGNCSHFNVGEPARGEMAPHRQEQKKLISLNSSRF
jgi:hypothetical protein